jgi:DNA ligase (NAD+)
MTKKEMIRDLERTLRRACDAYYNSDKLLMTDEEFDNACKTYEQMSGEKFNTKTAPKKKKVGKRQVNVTHTFENLTGTIDNKYPNLEDVKTWLKRCYKELDLPLSESLELMVSKKYDGNSAEGEFKDGKAVKFLTRGDDGEGADLTDIFSDVTICSKEHVGIRYEVMMTYENFNKLNKVKDEIGDNTYANPRSTVAGILGSNDGYKYKEYLTLVPLSMQMKDKEMDRYEELEFIDENVVQTDIEYDAEIFEGSFTELINGIDNFYQRMIVLRNNSEENLGYMIDGVVIELMDSDYKNQLGRLANGSPRWCCALKFPYMEKATYVEDIVFEASPNGSGRITPSAIYKPVYFNGAKQTKTSLANYKRFKEMKLGVGSKVMIEYRNEVISYVNLLDVPENEKIKPIPFTKTCPSCGTKKIRIHKNDKGEETFVYCDNPECPMKKVGKINKYTTEVGIKGIEVSTIEKLCNAGLLHDIGDLYRLKYKDVSKVEGLGDLSAMNIIDAIKDSFPNDYDILAGLGISNFGRDTAKTLLSETSLDSLCDKDFVCSEEFKERILKLDGIADKMAKYIIDGLSDNNALLNDILSNVKFKSVKREKAEVQYIFVTTGDPDHRLFENRTELKDYIEKKGHKLTGSISGKTNYLITEDTSSGTVKNREAQKRGIPIITCSELKTLLGD